MVKPFLSDRGIILSKKKIRERDLSFKIITENSGMISAIAFSGAVSRRRIGGKGEKFSTVSFKARYYQNYISIEELSLIKAHQELLTSIEKISTAELIAEIILKSIPEGTETKTIFNLLDSFLDSISTDKADLPGFLINLLRLEGYIELPIICKNCGKKLTDAYFVPMEGFFCNNCRKNISLKAFYFTQQEVDYLQHIAERKCDSILNKLLDIWEEILEQKIFTRTLLPNYTR